MSSMTGMKGVFDRDSGKKTSYGKIGGANICSRRGYILMRGKMNTYLESDSTYSITTTLPPLKSLQGKARIPV